MTQRIKDLIVDTSFAGSAILPIANGGTGSGTSTTAFDAISGMSALGDILYGASAGTRTRLAGNTTTTRKFLRQTGSGSASAAPAWDTILAADIPNAAADATTKGVATFVANDFTASSGLIGLNYTSGTAAATGAKGFLTSTDWNTFNNKVSPADGGKETVKSDYGNLGATATFNLATANWHIGTLSADLTSLTLSGWTNGKGCVMFVGLLQDGTGSWAVTWPAAVVNAPSVDGTPDTMTWISLWSYDGGTTIYTSSP